MSRIASTDHPIHELLAARWSPYIFNPGRTVSTADLEGIFEAARWTMSSYNAQPWRYIIGVRERSPDVWEKVLSVLVEANQAWAQYAPVLALGLTQVNFEHNGKPNRVARHDLGAASANLTVEATSRGVYVHQMLGIEPDKAREVFDVADTLEPLTALALGYRGDPAGIDDKFVEREQGERQRKPLSELILHGGC